MSQGNAQPGKITLSKATRQQRVGIVTAGWNEEVTKTLETGALTYLKEHHFTDDQCLKHYVPGSFELPLGVQLLAEHTNVKGIIAIGCLVKGETPHFHYIADAVTNRLSTLNLSYQLPIAYGLLTVNNQSQALERAGGQEGNKGQEAAEAVLQMMELKHSLVGRKNHAGF